MKCKDANRNISHLMYIDTTGSWYCMVGDGEEIFYADGLNCLVKYHTKVTLKDYEK